MFGFFRVFSGTFFADPQKDSFWDFSAILAPEGPDTPVNGCSDRKPWTQRTSKSEKRLEEGPKSLKKLRTEPEGRNAKGKNFWKPSRKKTCSQKIFQKTSRKIEDIIFIAVQSRSGYLRNLRGRWLSSAKFSGVFALRVFTLKPFPETRFQTFPRVSGGGRFFNLQLELFCLQLSFSAYSPLGCFLDTLAPLQGEELQLQVKKLKSTTLSKEAQLQAGSFQL